MASSTSTSTVNGETVTRAHEVVAAKTTDRWAECTCGHIFTGAGPLERATEHAENPGRDDDLLNILLVREGE